MDVRCVEAATEARQRAAFHFVMPGLVPAIHVFRVRESKTWMAGTRPAMTMRDFRRSSRSWRWPDAALRLLAPRLGAAFRRARDPVRRREPQTRRPATLVVELPRSAS